MKRFRSTSVASFALSAVMSFAPVAEPHWQPVFHHAPSWVQYMVGYGYRPGGTR